MTSIELQFSAASAMYFFLPIAYFSSVIGLDIFARKTLAGMVAISLTLGFGMLPTWLWEHLAIALGVEITNPWFNPHLVFLLIFVVCWISYFWFQRINKTNREQIGILGLFTAVFVVANIAHWTIVDRGFGPSLRGNGKFVQTVLGSQRFYGACIELDLQCVTFRNAVEAIDFAKREDDKFRAYSKHFIAGESNIQTFKNSAQSGLPAASSDSMHGWFEPNPMNAYVSRAVEGNSSWKGYYISDIDHVYRYVRSTRNEGEAKIRAQEAFFVALLISEIVWVVMGFVLLRFHRQRRRGAATN